MSIAQAHTLIGKLQQEPEFQAQLQQAANAAARRKILIEAGFGDVTLADLQAANTHEDYAYDPEMWMMAGLQPLNYDRFKEIQTFVRRYLYEAVKPMSEQPSRSLPPLSLLDPATNKVDESVRERVPVIEKTLADFGIQARMSQIFCGPRLAKAALKLGPEVSVDTIKRLEADLAVALSGSLVEIEPPGPGYPYISLVIENQRWLPVKLRQILESAAFNRQQAALKVGLGVDTFGQPVVIDLAALPHLLIGGTTGSGKSMCVHSLIAGLMCAYPPTELQFVLIDPIKVELQIYNGLPHLTDPVVTETGRVLSVLNDVLGDIDLRYRYMAELQARDITSYNQQAPQLGRKPMFRTVVIIDNLLDLMMNTPKEVEHVLTRIAQKARAAGVHMILATLRTNVATVAGAIKANFPGRIAFRTADRTDSQLILDTGGAEKLLGQGDMLFKSSEMSHLRRIQSVHISEAEIRRLVQHWTMV